MKVMVKDRMVIKTADFERMCTAPEELQLEINKIVSKTPKGRSFVRYIADIIGVQQPIMDNITSLNTTGHLERRM